MPSGATRGNMSAARAADVVGEHAGEGRWPGWQVRQPVQATAPKAQAMSKAQASITATSPGCRSRRLSAPDGARRGVPSRPSTRIRSDSGAAVQPPVAMPVPPQMPSGRRYVPARRLPPQVIRGSRKPGLHLNTRTRRPRRAWWRASGGDGGLALAGGFWRGDEERGHLDGLCPCRDRGEPVGAAILCGGAPSPSSPLDAPSLRCCSSGSHSGRRAPRPQASLSLCNSPHSRRWQRREAHWAQPSAAEPGQLGIQP